MQMMKSFNWIYIFFEWYEAGAKSIDQLTAVVLLCYSSRLFIGIRHFTVASIWVILSQKARSNHANSMNVWYDKWWLSMASKFLFENN